MYCPLTDNQLVSEPIVRNKKIIIMKKPNTKLDHWDQDKFSQWPPLNFYH